MKTLELKDATQPLAEYALDVDEEPVVVTKDGEPVAALVSLENVDRETLRLSTDRAFLELIDRSRKEQETEGGISTEEMRRRLF